jgi:dephospho-CoA kinase
VLTIGLTGGIGSGKSAVSRILRELGAEVIDADQIGHEVYKPGTPGWTRVVAEFGREVLAADGTIDRRKLGQRVFSDREALLRLNAIVHPLMTERIRERIGALRSGGCRAVVLEAAVLFEAGWDALVDEVWVVTSSEELAVERLVRDRGLSPDEVRRRLASQLPETRRLARADCVVRNTGTLDDLRAEVERLWRQRVG